MVYARKKVTKIVNFINKKRLKFFSEHPVFKKSRSKTSGLIERITFVMDTRSSIFVCFLGKYLLLEIYPDV